MIIMIVMVKAGMLLLIGEIKIMSITLLVMPLLSVTLPWGGGFEVELLISVVVVWVMMVMEW